MSHMSRTLILFYLIVAIVYFDGFQRKSDSINQHTGKLEGCTSGGAMGNAVSDGRPIAWKNRDDDGSPPHLVNYVTVSGGKYGILGVGYGSPFDIKMGVNDAGFSLVNSFCENMSGSSSYGDFKLFALSQMDSLAQMRQAIIEDTNGIVNHWDTEPAICVTFSDAHGYTSLFELQQRTISGLTYYEYNPVDPIRLTQFPRQIVVRSNTAHLNSNGQDDTSGDQRYTVARDDLVYHASNGGLTVKDWMQNISRHGQPSVDYLPNNYTTRAVFIVHGVNENEDPRITTAWLGLGNPDYTMVVPAWAAQTTNLSPRVTSGDSTGIAYVADALYYKHDHNYYDLYINSLFQPVENNIFEVVDNARSYWFSNGFNLEEATRIHMEAADTVWYTMNSMKAGSGRTLNVPPNLAAVNASTDGLVANFSLIASDGNGSITAYDWDFGDGTKSTVLSPTHTYTSAGTYLVRARVVDNGGARNSKWKYVTVSADIVTPTPTPTFTPTPTNTSTPTLTPTQPLTPTPPWTATDTPTDTSTPTSTPTLTATYTPTTTNTPTNTSTPTLTPTQPLTPTPPWTATDTPTDTSTPTSTPTLTATYTPTTTSTPTDTNTSTPTITPTNTATTTPTHPLATATPTVTASPSDTPTPTLSNTPTATSTPTPTDTPTPTNTPSATPSFTPTLSSDLIFADGFESGRLSAWSSNVNDGGDLSASSTAKLLGAFGLQAAIDDNNAIYVTDNLPNAEIRYRTRFYFDPNSIRMASSDTHYIFYGYSGTSTLVLRVQIRYLNATYQLRVALRNDSSTWTSSNWFTISDAPHAIELDWRAATISGAKNGGLTFWIDGTQLANLTGIDNDTRRIDTIWLGAVEGIDKGTRGTYFFDAFESHRQNYIGP